jgi:LAS superfamily LD-carboxypeptidase LdcB
MKNLLILPLILIPIICPGESNVPSPLAAYGHPGDVITGPEDTPWIVFAEHAEAREAPIDSARLVHLLDEGNTFVGEMVTDAETDIDWIRTQDFEREAFVVRSAVHRIHPNNLVEGNIPYGTEVVDRRWGLPLEYEPDDLTLVPAEWSSGNREYQLREEARDALVRMFEAARADGVELRVVSAYRSGPTQKSIYTRNIGRNPAQRSSAPPGHSEHQLGTCVDITDREAAHNFSRTFDLLPEGMWLEANAPRFGYHRSYRPENVGQSGYISEPWHWRYWGVGTE